MRRRACPPQLFVRESDPDGGNPRVRWISRAVDGLLGEQDASLLGQTFFEGASEDGDKVFFRTTSPLTVDDPNGVKDGGGNVVAPPPGGVTTGVASRESWDLYMYDFPDAAGVDPGDGELTRVSGGPGGASDCNNPQGNLSAFTPVSDGAGGELALCVGRWVEGVLRVLGAAGGCGQRAAGGERGGQRRGWDVRVDGSDECVSL